MDIELLCRGMVESNCYALVSDGEAVLIDAGAYPNDLEAALDRRGLRLKAILLTHGHFDHIFAASALKEKFGRDLVFWGGGVDTQKLLPFGTPKEVKEQVKERCEIFGKDGGFVFNAIHNLQANTPVENLVAMFEAVKEYNG
jgi:glyoxylase-like metal-dependent hydrolase (beta-lactamase superfamily II)